MSWVAPEFVIQKVIQLGIKQLRADPTSFNDIFAVFLEPEFAFDYGQPHIDAIRKWFNETKLPVVQAWSFNADKIPGYSIHLAGEVEDEQKAALGDYAGTFDEDEGTVGTGVFTVNIDVGIHANRDGDQVLWLYYILSYILFKHKRLIERFGIQLQTYSASDYNKQPQYMTENIWTRWLRFRCTTQNYWADEPLGEAENLEVQLVFDRVDNESDS